MNLQAGFLNQVPTLNLKADPNKPIGSQTLQALL